MTLKPVYTASNSMEAHLVKIMLIGQGIEAFVEGDLLQGGIGDLPAVGMMQVRVRTKDVQAAQAAIQEWESDQGNEDDSWIPPQLR